MPTPAETDVVCTEHIVRFAPTAAVTDIISHHQRERWCWILRGRQQIGGWRSAYKRRLSSGAIMGMGAGMEEVVLAAGSSGDKNW